MKLSIGNWVASITFGKVSTTASTRFIIYEHCFVLASIRKVCLRAGKVRHAAYASIARTAHPCNVKEFEVHVGLAPDRMSEVLHARLQDDSTPETFPVRHSLADAEGMIIPSLYLKIVPLT